MIPKSLQSKLDSGCAIFNLNDTDEQMKSDDGGYKDLKHETNTMKDYEEAAWGWDSPEGTVFRDNLSGEILPPDLVAKARQEEMAYVRHHRVYERVTRAQCFQETEASSQNWMGRNKQGK